MENLIVGLIVAASFAYLVKKFVKMWRGEGGCSCSGGCGGCPGNEGPCGRENGLIK